MLFLKFLVITSINFYSTNLISSDAVLNFAQISKSYIYGNDAKDEMEDYYDFMEEIDYCDLNCDDVDHTACVPDGGNCPTTCSRGEYTALTQAQQKAILDIHNSMRNKVSSGQESAASLGGVQVANMQLLRWDPNAEYVAECHVKKCIKGHDSCRRLNTHLKCGQNIAYIPLKYESQYEIMAKDFFNRAVYSWYDQVKHCNCNFMVPFSELGANALAFTQFIWAETSRIGCAYMKNTDQSGAKLMLVCNYCPVGNLPNHFVFQQGQLMHLCDSPKQFPHLCDLSQNSNIRRKGIVKRSAFNDTRGTKKNDAVGVLNDKNIAIFDLIGVLVFLWCL